MPQGQTRDARLAALILLAGATTGEGNFLANYDDKPLKQSHAALSVVDEKNWKELANHQANFTEPLQKSLMEIPVLYIRGSNDNLFPASAAAYLGLQLEQLQMVRRSSDQDSLGVVNYEATPLYAWDNCKSGQAPKVMAVVKDATHPLYFLDAGKNGSLQTIRDEINAFLQRPGRYVRVVGQATRLLHVRALYANDFDEYALSRIADHQFSVSRKDSEG